MRPQIEKPENQNQELELTGQAWVGKTSKLINSGWGLAGKDTAGHVFWRVWNQAELF
jgi:hypothetical protein